MTSMGGASSKCSGMNCSARASILTNQLTAWIPIQAMRVACFFLFSSTHVRFLKPMRNLVFGWATGFRCGCRETRKILYRIVDSISNPYHAILAGQETLMKRLLNDQPTGSEVIRHW